MGEGQWFPVVTWGSSGKEPETGGPLEADPSEERAHTPLVTAGSRPHLSLSYSGSSVPRALAVISLLLVMKTSVGREFLMIPLHLGCSMHASLGMMAGDLLTNYFLLNAWWDEERLVGESRPGIRVN